MSNKGREGRTRWVWRERGECRLVIKADVPFGRLSKALRDTSEERVTTKEIRVQQIVIESPGQTDLPARDLIFEC